MDETFLINLPDDKKHYYTLKPSRRAKYIRIKLNNKGELSVTLPYRISAKQAHRFVQSKAGWIARQLSRLPEPADSTIPDDIKLQLTGDKWQVCTAGEDNSTLYLEIDNTQKIIHFSGNKQQVDVFRQMLEQWLKQIARPIFSQMLELLAERHGFHFNRLSIRAQKTRWGSCSSNKNISLNCKLLFLPKKVVEYVMIHELCHTIQMNHSDKFWQLVEDCDPDFQAHRAELKKFKSL